MGLLSLTFASCLSWSFLMLGIESQLQSSQSLAILQLWKHLEYPNYLEVWRNTKNVDICYLPPLQQVNTTCSANVLTELRIIGDKPSNLSPDFDGHPISNQTLSYSFSIDSFVITLSRLSSLRVLKLVSVGIWGQLPDKLHRLSSLEILDLNSNFLYGSIPPEIAKLEKLGTLALEGNFLNDTIPDWIGSLSNLTVFSVRNNQLKGPLPDSLSNIKNLSSLTLANNKISGDLPDLSGLASLTILDLSSNELGGNMPSETLFSLPNLSFLNLASNQLGGSLPYHMTCGSKLWFVDISNNRLTGGLPECLRRKKVNAFGNCLTVDVQHQHPTSYCSEAPASDHVRTKLSPAKRKVIILVSVIGAIIIAMAVLGLLFLLFCRKYCPRGCAEQYLLTKQVQENSMTAAAGVTSEVLANARFISKAKRSGTQGIPACRVYTIEEVKEATNNFDQSAFMGEGCRGKVYRGSLQNGTQVAIRCLNLSDKHTIRNLKLRLDLMAKLRNPHLVCLLGHCIESAGREGGSADSDKVFLVYEYMPNGNLRSHLSAASDQLRTLKWPQRLAILIDVAKAVHFLHTGIIPGFFNNRLKTHNILLDEHHKAKLSDYGLSIISDEGSKTKAKRGEPKSWQMEIVEDDVYTFGLILLELLVGPSVPTKRETALLSELTSEDQDARRRIVDPVILATSEQESLSTVISITSKCVSSETSTRPSFEDIIWNLQYADQVQATADGDQRFSSPPQ